ncbi:MAG: UDP-N-acetylenolpyruvoylglucosamine reductase, UDP-N-acetylmuramate dehydrogenase [Microgenomates group bacterium GW2011_GWC1_41_8]|uniref:UDP-N-acetylenolpyruvoylglucosamine reductase n=3 Tax=Candidatus Roizmaniibacteriota TaxID=1752723 RepID=A0A0G0TCR1_9BACT|nr:MAG: UDP-N-acetylenolpyruvoylglucosamine reductase [Candidatus Levybacteria bacterium GW2011_GWA2_40_16]KKR72591.1 MAG: UDP-N-acetylenolpyruvoylglucosamine reductase [Candidatus Roizmanbacteria bacterium GW2011_GWB1_40_7]KKR95032.1 MAG: UDP-N-acetylenolpyruvoylglucosamine reductase [Candidatus Roizmanbacteria bacterium GW2011_GWA1_41_13]KKS24786.1 MAG: UDP-N-acetylenolpyruvoylglucosamine reductase, UDP-N-acetylmuramate dehydrogenase [Microgenomates group bacterium GW2011_GWC1_41_8]
MTIIMNILEQIPLLQFTNWRIGGPADYFVEVDSLHDLQEALRFASDKKIPYVVLGGGTNVLVGDKGFRGLVIKNKMNTISIIAYKGRLSNSSEEDRKNVYVKADTGVLVNRLVRYTLDQGLSGLENFLGQPGTVGGAIYINAHNMSQNDFFGSHVVEADIISDNKVTTVPQSYFEFGYDVSTLQKTKQLVVSVVVGFEQRLDEKEQIWKKAEAAMQHRHATQPKGFPTAGCTFRNISAEDAKRAKIPNNIQSAGFLIDACGLKGKQIGNAKFSDEHANFILNMGGATAQDVKQLIDLAKTNVKEKFGINLHEEVVLIGEF